MREDSIQIELAGFDPQPGLAGRGNWKAAELPLDRSIQPRRTLSGKPAHLQPAGS
jgi:hypothetical protein